MSSVVLSSLYSAISTSIYDELLTKESTLYSFIGKTTDFVDDENRVTDNITYDHFIRSNIVFAKKLNLNDISFVVPRYNWGTGVVYDQYDDNYYGSYVTSIQVSNGGSGYTTNTTATAIATGGGGGVVLSVVVDNGVVVSIVVTDGGYGFTSIPQITINGAGSGAVAVASISTNNLSYSGKSSLKDSRFYVVTNEYNVYKCLYNNLNAQSTVRPTHVTVDPYTTADGYVWKFMYHIPLGLRKKFLNTSFMPVYSVLSSSYYNNGGIDYVEVTDGGSGYTSTTPLLLYVVGDGISGKFDGKINSTRKEIESVSVVNSGTGYNKLTEKMIYSIQRTGDVVTLTTNTAHNLVVGSIFALPADTVLGGVLEIETVIGDATVTLMVDSTFSVVSVVDNTTITFISPGADVAPTVFGNVAFPSSETLSIASVVRSNNVVTLTTTTTHLLNEGNVIIISGLNGYNGSYTIAKYISPTIFSFYQFGVDDTVSGTGSVDQSAISILDIVRASNVVTVTTYNSHNFKQPISITSITRASNIATVVTSAINNERVGDTIIISGTSVFNGTYVIVSIVNTTTFTINSVGGDTTENTGMVNSSVNVSSADSFNGTFPVNDIVDSKTFTYTQNGDDYISYIPQKLSYDTDIALSSNTGVSGKYGNNTAILTPNILVQGGVNYVSAPLVIIKGTTGSGATAIATESGGKVISIAINDKGSGYTSEPKVFFNGGSTNQVTATPNITAGVISGFVINNNGLGYATAPDILIVGDGTGATATANVSGGSIISITVSSGGSGYTSATVYFTGTSDYCCAARAILYNNTVERIDINSIIDSIAINDPGNGYDDGYTTTIAVDGDGVGAVFTPYIRDGSIAAVVTDNAGEGYTYADLTVNGDGTGAQLRASVNVTNILGQVDTSQYNVEALAVNGAVSSVVVVNGGTGYTNATATISGNGTGATASVVLNGDVVEKVLLTNQGLGYTTSTVIISGDGTGATARAILSPPGGHGYNAIYELFGNKIITYTKISNSDLYDGFGFTNQFYQYGIIANPKQFTATKVCTDLVVSPCVNVSGSFVLDDFPLNATLRITVDSVNKDYTIVDRTATNLLLQTIEAYLPVVGDTITNIGNSISFNIVSVTQPTMNINTGSIIDINNSPAFYKTQEQIISLRTLISL